MKTNDGTNKNNELWEKVMMYQLKKTLIFRRFCWRTFGFASMVVYPQKVPYYGRHMHDEVGVADCVACGKSHILLGGHGMMS